MQKLKIDVHEVSPVRVSHHEALAPGDPKHPKWRTMFGGDAGDL